MYCLIIEYKRSTNQDDWKGQREVEYLVADETMTLFSKVCLRSWLESHNAYCGSIRCEAVIRQK